MKIAIITFIRAYNYGATLQAYALQKTLQKKGLDVDVLDYAPDYFKELYWLTFISHKMRRRPYRPFKKWLKYQIAKNNLRRRNEKYGRFLLNNIRLSERQYCRQNDLNGDTTYGGYIVGSDQVWNSSLTNFDPVFFLDWTHPQKPLRFSYAASFGENKIPENLAEKYRQLLAGWDGHSVRERSGVSLLSNLISENVVQCCDPSLLLTAEEWDEIAAKKASFRKPYIMVYYVNHIRNVVDHAKKLREATGLDVLLFTSITQEEQLLGNIGKDCGFISMVTAAPDEFLSYIKNAEYIISDSFHCTVLSILYHKQFFIAPLNGSKTVNARVADLLTCLGIERKPDVDGIEDRIDWNQVDTALQEYRLQSIEYLDRIVSAAKEHKEG